MCRSRWPCGLRRRPEAAYLLGSQIRKPLRCSSVVYVVCCVCCVLCIGLCIEPITGSEQSYWILCVCVCVYVCV